MSTITADLHAHPHAEHAHHGSFLSTYVFSRDHKIIGIQFLFSTLIWFFVGGMLALGVRWQLAWPWSPMPIVGNLMYRAEGGQIAPEAYTMLFTMHATVMIFFVIIPILAGAFGNFLIPLMIGADDMAFPTLNMLSYWFMWPAFFCIGLSFLWPPYGAGAGWTSYPPLSAVPEAAPGSAWAQTMWLLGITCVGVSSMLGSVNYMTTIIQMRAPGMTMFRLPLAIWAMFITAILQAFALPVLTAAGLMQLADRLVGTGFFVPEGLIVNNSAALTGGGQPLLWQHLFWFYSHPAVYIMILPAMGMVSDMIACFARKPLFGYDTYLIVAYLHYVLFAATGLGVFGGIYFWFPKIFGRIMDETLGKIHFFLSFVFLNGTFYTMHILGAVGFPRRLADPYDYETFKHLLPMNQFMSICAILMVASQVIFAFNFIRSMFFGTPVWRNPLGANSLEWFAPSPPGHGNFDMQPVVYRGPYEFGSPEVDTDNYPQWQPPPTDPKRIFKPEQH